MLFKIENSLQSYIYYVESVSMLSYISMQGCTDATVYWYKHWYKMKFNNLTD